MKNRILFIIASLILIISCYKEQETENVYFSIDHTEWFKYEVGDTLIFKSNASAVDTYIIDKVQTFYMQIPTDEFTFYEIYQVFYKEFTQCNNCPVDRFVRNPNGVSFLGDFSSLAAAHTRDTTSDYKLGDTTIHNVFVVEDIPVDTLHFKVKTIYYSHDYGYIRYDMYDDRVYELQLE